MLAKASDTALTTADGRSTALRAPARVLSIRQPWAWLIVHGFKPIENRTWTTDYRGNLLIHAASKPDRVTQKTIRDCYGIILPPARELRLGGIIGEAELVDVVEYSSSAWFTGPYGFVLALPKPRRFRPLKGQQRIFTID
jgi:hypothetical protein